MTPPPLETGEERGRRHRAGFSLVEALIAIGMIVVLLGVLFVFLGNVLRRTDAAREIMGSDRGLDAFFADVERSLLTTFVGDREEEAGVKAGAGTLRVLCRGTVVDGARVTDLRGVEYRVEGGVLQGRRWGAEGVGEEAWETIATGIEAMRVRCFDGREWAGEFDSFTAGKLPGAVEVAVWRGERADKTEESSGSGERAVELPRRAAEKMCVFGVPDAGGGG